MVHGGRASVFCACIAPPPPRQLLAMYTIHKLCQTPFAKVTVMPPFRLHN